MYSQIATVAFQGIEAKPVDVQVLVAPGLPSFSIVGLPDKAVAESRERVRAALTAIGVGLPPKRITVNLAPADLPKEGSHYDLPIALGLLSACQAIPGDILLDFCVIGELGLDGSIATVIGALPAAISAHSRGMGLICPAGCGAEAAWAGEDVAILAPDHLLGLVSHLRGSSLLTRPIAKTQAPPAHCPDLKDVKGQENAKRALEIAAAGGHHLLMCGPPGAGKSMLAQRLPSILPPMEPREILEVAMIHSMAGLLPKGRLTDRRPFRAPHHSATMAALVGGGARPQPGEIALAHNGVLFLDELPEFAPHVIDALRQPLETGETVIARANHHISYPSRIQLVAAMNPCRCGRAGEPGYSCKQGPRCAERYKGRLSGPLLDRIDLMLDIPAVTAKDLALPAEGETSATIRARVTAARMRQSERLRALGADPYLCNANCPASLIDQIAAPDRDGEALLTTTAQRFRLSARGYYRTLRVARTLADLDGEPNVRYVHVAEALAYRGECTLQPAA